VITEDRFRDDIAAYLLSALGEAETREIELHLDGCEECRRELNRLRVAADALPRSVEPIAPPPALKRELMRAVAGEGRRRGASPAEWLRRLLAVPRLQLAWGAAAVVLALGVAIGWAATRTTTRVVSASVAVPGASARLVIPPGSGAILRVSGMPGPAPGRIYEMWLERGGRTLPSSLFSVGASGSGAAAIPGSLDGVTRVLVTSERAGGAARPTGAPLIVVRA
jgi:anti-sigma-K factor RskA